MRRSPTQSTTTYDPGCDTYRPNYQTLTAFSDYKSTNLNTDPIGNYISTSLSSDLAGNTPNRSVAEMQMNVQTNMTELQNLETKVYGMTRCLQAEILQRSERAGDIYKLQEQLTQEEKDARAMELTAKDAKERAKFLEDPYSKTTRHELWFPLGRPLKMESVPVLLSISIAFLVLALGMFLRMMSVELRLTSPWLSALYARFFTAEGTVY